MVQIDSVEDNSVKGVMAFVTVDEKGAVSAVRQPMSGTINDKLLNLSVENGSGVSLVTGIVSGDKLELTFFGNGQSSKIEFAKQDASAFDTVITDTRKKAAQIKQDTQSASIEAEQLKRRSAAQKRIDALASNLFDQAGKMNTDIGNIDGIITLYGAVAKRAIELKSVGRGLVPTPDQGSYRIDQISYKLETNRDRANTMHSDLQAYARRVAEEYSEHSSDAASLLADCANDDLLECGKLSASLQAYGGAVASLRNGVARETAAFNAARGKF